MPVVLVTDGTSDADERGTNLVGVLYEPFADAADGARFGQCAVLIAVALLVADHERIWKQPFVSGSW